MSTTAADQELSDEAFTVLRAAVNLARDHNIQKVAVLRQRLEQVFPRVSAEVIDSALRFWARRLVATQST